MNEWERVEAFATFLGLSTAKLCELADERGLVSQKTFSRIARRQEQGASHDHRRSLAKLADFIDPEYLASPIPTDPFPHSEVGAGLTGVAWVARNMWKLFLEGEAVEVPTWDTICAQWAFTCRSRPDTHRFVSRAENHPQYQESLDRLHERAVGEGVISGERSPDDLLRWCWTGAPVGTELWLRMRAAFHYSQLWVEETASIVYTASAVLSFMLLHPKIWAQRLGDGRNDGEETAAEVMNRAVAQNHWVRNSKLRANSGFWGVVNEGSAGEAAANLLKACFMRSNSFWDEICRRAQTVFALFDEQLTRQFFSELQVEEREACADRLLRLESRGLVLLASKLSVQEQHDLCFSVSVGGEMPAVATGFSLMADAGTEQNVAIARAGTADYERARHLFDDVANNSRTKRMQASDVRSLVLNP